MDQALKEKLTAKDKWLRLVYIFLFLLINYFVHIISLAISAFQFISNLLTNKTNQHLVNFSRNLSTYAVQILRFITYVTDDKPYPFSDWPNTIVKEADATAKSEDL